MSFWLSFTSLGPRDISNLYISSTNEVIYQYSIDSSIDVTSISYDQKSNDVSSIAPSINGFSWSKFGNKVFIVEDSNDNIYEFEATTPYDIESISYTGVKFDLSNQISLPQDLVFNDTGEDLYVLDYGSIYKYNLGSPFSLSNVNYDSIVFSEQDVDNYKSFKWGVSGDEIFLSGHNDSNENYLIEYTLSSSFDLTSASFENSKNVSSEISESGHSNNIWNKSGNRSNLMDIFGPTLYEYSTNTAFDSSGLTHTGNTFTFSEFTSATALEIDVPVHYYN